MRTHRPLCFLLLATIWGCSQPTESEPGYRDEALQVEKGIALALRQTPELGLSESQVEQVSHAMRQHLGELSLQGQIGYREQALELSGFGEAFEGVPQVTVTTNGAFGSPGPATNGGFGGAGGSTSGTLGGQPGGTGFGSPSTTNTSLNQAVGIVCSEFGNVRVDIGGGDTGPVCDPIDPTCMEPIPGTGDVLSVGFGCVAAGSRPVINWAAAGSGQIITVNVSYADITALSGGFMPSEAWARNRIWMSPVSGGSVVYGGPTLRSEGGLGFLVGVVEVSGGSAVFIAFVL